jgi:hypothetical protein
MTKQKQYEHICDAVETAIIQAAEISGLRNWLIWLTLNNLKECPPIKERIVQNTGATLLPGFEGMIDPDDQEFFNSELYKNRATAKIFGGIGNKLKGTIA